MESPNRQKWTGVPPALASRRPGMPTDWVPVVDPETDDMINPLPDGYVLLDVGRGRQLRAWAAHLEFRETPPQHRRTGPPAP